MADADSAPPFNSSPSRSPLPCPRCGQPLGQPFPGSALCARCASARILAHALSDEPDSMPPFALPGDASGPARIGPYTIISELGRGGMGIVYLAQHAQLGRIVALKTIHCGGTASSALEMRFLREAQTVAQLRHPHIVTVHDAGQADHHAYFAMDFVEGGDLAQRLRAQRQFEPRTAALLMQQVAAAIAYSHGEGVLHRDLKPSNILLAGDAPLVADFGLAAQPDSGASLTGAMIVLGTPHYSAPEVLRGPDLGARGAPADIYALGVILYELLAGRTPFAGASPGELPALVATTEPPPLRLLAPQVPRDLETICRCCLAIEPAQRYSSARALAEDLRHYLAGEPIVARPISPLGQLWRWTRRRPHLAAVWALSLLLAIGSTVAAFGLNRARLQTAAAAARAETALAAARQSEQLARSRLRGAKFAEARARRATAEPGRRTAILAALAEADAVEPGRDLRDEAMAALMLPEFIPTRRWIVAADSPVIATVDPTGRVAAIEDLVPSGDRRQPLSLRRWGETASFAQLDVPGTTPAGPAHFSGDGLLIAARYHDESIRVWRTADGRALPALQHQPLPEATSANPELNDDVDFTPDHTALCVGQPGGGLTWRRLSDGAELARSPGEIRFSTVRCSPDGRRVAACSLAVAQPHQLYLYAQPGTAPERIFTLASAPRSLAWSTDGTLLIVAQSDNSVTIFDVAEGRVVQSFNASQWRSQAVDFLGGRTFVTLSNSGSAVHVFDFALNREAGEFPSVGPGGLTRDQSGNGFYLTSLEGEITYWELHPPVGFRLLLLPDVAGYEFSGDAGGLDFSNDGRWAASAHGRFAALRDVATGAFVGELDGGPAEGPQFSSVMFNQEGTALLRCSTTTGLRRHTLSNDAHGRLQIGPAATLDPEPGFVLTAHTTDRRLVVLINRYTGDVKVLDLSGPASRLVSRWRTPGVYHGSLNPDGTELLLNCNGLGPDAASMRLSVHRVADGRLIAEPVAPVSCDTAWSADGRTALTSAGLTETILWNAATWTRRAVLPAGLGGNTTTFAIAPDSSYAVVCRESHIYLVDLRDGRVRATLTAPGAPGLATAVRFLPDGAHFAVLWPDGRLDLFEPAALNAALAVARIR
ncbi:protein kinase [Horticoccus luteus]|uniref:Protein kinase n=1 Tax=Horticoccus luteus TaxID=2862869 RepID=A0A8F9TUZ1_9BACT|nr:serine/threonine-protein kinase [Horticoccus luteus]QYM78258.1 protein kinase [Horticoccus luteus]